MAFREENKKLFPLRSISDVEKLFRNHLNSDHEPDLTLLSIVIGIFENTLTTTNTNTAASQLELLNNFPIVEFSTVESLYKKFQTILTSLLDLKQPKTTKTLYATREIIKKISDVIWNSLARSNYKDRAHLQSLYSYLTGNKLDCFGVAYAVVAGCQLLGFTDAHLAISEDHVWVVFGKNSDETVEVTWHGKGSEDKRGLPITTGVESQSWLYVAGNPVVCNRYMEVAALVSAINPSLNMTSTCKEVEDLQKQLLWILYDLEHLKKYPMALGCLGELEEASPTLGRPSCEVLFAESVNSAKFNYKNHHVYPYTYQGCYYSRNCSYREAFSAWANAGDVIRLYNYSRDDEEIYKEFIEIANELIPQIMKLESSGHSAKSILRDPQCFANLLRFYDGICQWEEGSQTPILHIGWAKPLVSTIAKFDYDIRSQIIINCVSDDIENNKLEKETDTTTTTTTTTKNGTEPTNPKQQTDMANNNNNNISPKTELNKTETDENMIPTLEALTAACGEKILNPDFLLQGGGQPFTETKTQGETSNVVSETEEESSAAAAVVVVSVVDTEIKEIVSVKEILDEIILPEIVIEEIKAPKFQPPVEEDFLIPKRPVITLYSHKMKGLKDLLLSERLNTQAISLQVTAQSQVQVGKKFRGSLGGDYDGNTRPKRARRE